MTWRGAVAVIVSVLAGTLATSVPATGADAPPPLSGAEFRAGTEFKDCPECPRMIVLPAGAFVMGSPADEPGRRLDEAPRHAVTFATPFALGRFEVSFIEWDACTAALGCPKLDPYEDGWSRGRRPVINVNWHDAHAYVAWLAVKTGKPYRLPSESEWEYAARGGTASAYATGDRITIADANFTGQPGRTQEVGSYAANGFGLHDMTGNVAEWVEDRYVLNYLRAPTDGRPVIDDGLRRVLRGGSRFSSAEVLRSAARIPFDPLARDSGNGFRVAMALTPLHWLPAPAPR
ncbi:exported hypothetical protein [uncultured Gammaproteobacteria bacterium]